MPPLITAVKAFFVASAFTFISSHASAEVDLATVESNCKSMATPLSASYYFIGKPKKDDKFPLNDPSKMADLVLEGFGWIKSGYEKSWPTFYNWAKSEIYFAWDHNLNQQEFKELLTLKCIVKYGLNGSGA